MADDKPIIIIKKKGGHGGHHGGAWKVAYADFVTAMMAFFMVMWLVNTAEQQTKQNIASYFRRPGLFQSGSGTPLLIGEAGILPDAFVPPHKADTKKQGGKEQDNNLPKNTGTDEQRDSKKKITIKGEQGKDGGLKDAQGKQGLLKDNTKTQGELSEKQPPPPPQTAEEQALLKKAEDEKALISKIAEEIKDQIASSKALQELLGIVDVKIDADGLNIEIMDTEKSSMFASGSARIEQHAQDAFAKLAEILRKLPNSIDIIGHTDAKPFSNRVGGYSNWELSSDRAQAARRLLEENGIEPLRFTSVIGRSDKEPRLPKDPMAAANRRITLKMRFKFSKKIDLGKDPNALSRPDAFKAPVLVNPGGQNILGFTPQEPPKPASATGDDKVHSLTTKEVTVDHSMDHYVPKNAVSAKERTDVIKLDDAAPADQSGTSKPTSKGPFGDNPVVGSGDIFSGF